MRIAILTALVAATCFSGNAMAQGSSEAKKSVVVLDVNMDRIKDSQLAKTLNLEAQLGKAASAASKDAANPSSLKRFVMMMSLPDTVAEAKTMADGEMPVDFYGRMQFKDAPSATKMLDKIKSEGVPVELNGKTFYRPKPDTDRPENMLASQVDATTIEVATESYATLPDRNVMSDGLQTAWQSAGDDAIRIAIDIEGASSLVTEAIEQGKASVKDTAQEAQVSAFLGLIDNMKNLRLAIDFSSDHLLKIDATGVDEKQAQELQGGLDALLGMGKMMGSMQLGGLAQQDPDAAAVASEILQSLQANREGTEVNVTIPHPAGLQALAEKFAPNFGGAPSEQPQLQEAPAAN
jgi:hypothetical protein